mgnify:CR=1 FL=1
MKLTSTSDVIDALGGIGAVAQMTGRKYGAAAQWPHFTSFPSNTYLVLTEALKAKGLTAPAALWGMTAAQDQQAAAS